MEENYILANKGYHLKANILVPFLQNSQGEKRYAFD